MFSLLDGHPVFDPTKSDAFLGWDTARFYVAKVPDPAVSILLERSVDGGDTWERVFEGNSLTQISDPEALSNGVTMYRVTTVAATGAATVREYPMSADSDAVWLNGGVALGMACRLPYDPTYSTSPERERGIWQLAGNTRVAWAGEQAGETVTVGGRLIENDENVASHKDLGNLFLDPEPLHMVRTPNGTRVHGVLSSPDLSRTPGVGIWNFGFTVTEADRGE